VFAARPGRLGVVAIMMATAPSLGGMSQMQTTFLAGQGRPERPLFLPFTDVSAEELAAISAEPSKEKARARLAAAMDLDQDEDFRCPSMFPGISPKRCTPWEIAADLHFYNFLFCHSASFDPAKTSCFLSIMKQVMGSMISEGLTERPAFELLQALLLKHSVPRPPVSIAIFNINDLKVITDYVLNTFFRHFKLYQYVYVAHRELKLRTRPNRFVPSIPDTVHMQEKHLVQAKAQEELAEINSKPRAMEDLCNELFSELAEREGQIAGDVQKVIAMALDQKAGQIIARFEQAMEEQDREFQARMAE